MDYVNSFWYFLGASVYLIPVIHRIHGPLFCHLAVKNQQIIQSSTRKGSETGQLKKASNNSLKNSKTSSKSDLVQEAPVIKIDESFASENFENNVGSPQQVRDC